MAEDASNQMDWPNKTNNQQTISQIVMDNTHNALITALSVENQVWGEGTQQEVSRLFNEIHTWTYFITYCKQN